MSLLDWFRRTPAAAKMAAPATLPIATSSPYLADLFRGTGQARSLADWEAEAGSAWLSLPVAACLRWFTVNFPSAWLALYTESTDPAEPDAPDYRADIVRAVGATRGMSLSELWALSVVSDAVWGETYWIKRRTLGGAVAGFRWVPPKTGRSGCRWGMEPVGSATEDIAGFKYWVDGRVVRWEGGSEVLDPDEVVYVRQQPDPDEPRRGLSWLRSGVRLMVGHARADELAADVLGNTTTSKVFIPDQAFAYDDAEEESIRSSYDGAIRMGKRLPVMKVAGRFEDIGRTPSDMGLDFLSDRFAADICALLGVDPSVVGLAAGMQRRTYENQAAAQAKSWTDALIPLQDRFADAITIQCRADFGLGDGQYLGWDRTRINVLQDDAESKFTRGLRLYVANMGTLNQALALAGLAPVDAARGGDKFYYELTGSTTPASAPPGLGMGNLTDGKSLLDFAARNGHAPEGDDGR